VSPRISALGSHLFGRLNTLRSHEDPRIPKNVGNRAEYRRKADADKQVLPAGYGNQKGIGGIADAAMPQRHQRPALQSLPLIRLPVLPGNPEVGGERQECDERPVDYWRHLWADPLLGYFKPQEPPPESYQRDRYQNGQQDPLEVSAGNVPQHVFQLL
jgi:hypothetical protein